MCAVLVLGTPPDESSAEEWYCRKIVGVPFLLLNLLHLQKGGVERVTIFTPEDSWREIGRFQELAKDSRLTLKLDWVSDTERLETLLQDSSCRLALSGFALYEFGDIAAALDGTLAPEKGDEIGLRTVPRSMAHQIVEYLQTVGDSVSRGLLVQGSEEVPENKLMVLIGNTDMRVRRGSDFRLQRERLLARAGMASDSFMDRWVSRHFSRIFTRLLIDTPVTPNQITWMHLVVGVGSAWFFYQGTHTWAMVGAVVLMLSSWLDATDGEVARLRFQQSRFGMMLDIIGDNVVHWAVFLGIGWGAAQATGNDIFKLCAVFSVAGAVLSFLLLQGSVIQMRSGGEYEPSGWADELANRDFLYFLFVMALINQLYIFIAITAVGSNIFAGYVFYLKRKSSQTLRGINH